MRFSLDLTAVHPADDIDRYGCVCARLCLCLRALVGVSVVVWGRRGLAVPGFAEEQTWEEGEVFA